MNAGEMRFALVHCDVGQDHPEFVLHAFPVQIGRNPAAQLRLTDHWASRTHCQIENEGGRLVVRDLGSRHGTWVNGRRVDHAPLCPGDRLVVGLTTFSVTTLAWEGGTSRSAMPTNRGDWELTPEEALAGVTATTAPTPRPRPSRIQLLLRSLFKRMARPRLPSPSM